MRAEDLEPTRMDAAKARPRAFVERQPESVEIGVVAFGDGGVVIQPPTNAQADVLAAIDRLDPLGRHLAGPGPVHRRSAPSPASRSPSTPRRWPRPTREPRHRLLRLGAIVLLSDGENTADPDPLAVAEVASVAGVRVYPIGIGSREGHGGRDRRLQRGHRARRGRCSTRSPRSPTATYFRAEDAAALAEIYDSIDLRLTTDAEHTEVTRP